MTTPDSLTPRQAEVLNLLAQGLRVREVAAHLYISIDTVRWHLKAAYRALGVHTRREALALVTTPGAITTRCPYCGCRRRWSPA